MAQQPRRETAKNPECSSDPLSKIRVTTRESTLCQGRAAGNTEDNIDLWNGAIAVNQKMIHQTVTVPMLHQ